MATFKKGALISSKIVHYRVNLISKIEFVSSVSYKFRPNTHLQVLIACIYDATCHFCNCAYHCTNYIRHYACQTSEPRDLRSDGIHFKNKYKFMILKVNIMLLINEAFFGSQPKYKIYITISIRVLFGCLISSHNIFQTTGIYYLCLVY